MAKSSVRDIDFTVARLHARHAGILSGERLDRACAIRTIPELARLRWPDDAPPTMTAAEFQRRVADEFAEEMEFLARNVPQGVRLFFETLQESSRPRRHKSLEEDNAAARKYYETLLDRAKACTPPDDVPALTLARQEAATFIATACLRLVFNYGLSPQAASSCYFGGTPIDGAMFHEAATAPDLASALPVDNRRTRRRGLGPLPPALQADLGRRPRRDEFDNRLRRHPAHRSRQPHHPFRRTAHGRRTQAPPLLPRPPSH